MDTTVYGYIILWRGKKYEVRSTDTRLNVKEEFCREHRIKKPWEASVYLAEVDGKQVATHLD